ncbi:hypothetical protein B4Q13_15625, partial [Lacticaseibacillus rhamnosus]
AVSEQDGKVIDTIIEDRKRFDFTFTVRHITLQVEKKIVEDRDGERRVVSASTAELGPPRYAVTCNGRTLPLSPTGTHGEYVAGVRYRAWQPSSALHPTIPVHSPLVFDVLDRWSGRSTGRQRSAQRSNRLTIPLIVSTSAIAITTPANTPVVSEICRALSIDRPPPSVDRQRAYGRNRELQRQQHGRVCR